jgi:hypothetical protein
MMHADWSKLGSKNVNLSSRGDDRLIEYVKLDDIASDSFVFYSRMLGLFSYYPRSKELRGLRGLLIRLFVVALCTTVLFVPILFIFPDFGSFLHAFSEGEAPNAIFPR